MHKFGVNLPDEHWSHAEDILDSSASEDAKRSAMDDWLTVTAGLLLAKSEFETHSSEAIVKTFGRIILYHAKRPDLLRLSYVRSKLKRGSNGSVLKWIDELMKEAVSSVSSSHELAGIPDEVKDIAAEMMSKLWRVARIERERPTLHAERKEIERYQAELESASRTASRLGAENERLRAEMDELKITLRQYSVELEVAKGMVEKHREESAAQALKFNDTIEQLRRSIDLADEQRKNAMMEIDRARDMSRPLEAENKRLRQKLAEESVMTEQYRNKANAFEIKVGELQLALENKK